MKKIAFLTAVAALAIGASPASAAIVTNGNFSTNTPAAGNTNGNFQLNAAGTYGTVAGWTTTSGYNILFNAGNATSSAGKATGQYNNNEWLRTLPTGASGAFMMLDGDSNFQGGIQQTLSGLVNGQQYTLSFDWAASSMASGAPGALTAGLTGLVNGKAFGVAADNIPSSAFKTASYTFTYSSAGGNVLSFLANGTPNGTPPVTLLDNVSIAAVPEPATWAMMLVGFGMVGASSRYRRRKTLVATA